MFRAQSLGLKSCRTKESFSERERESTGKEGVVNLGPNASLRIYARMNTAQSYTIWSPP
jgi:hypothetical protein